MNSRPHVSEEGLLDDTTLLAGVPYTLYCMPDRTLLWFDGCSDVFEYSVVANGESPAIVNDRLNLKALKPGRKYTIESSGAPRYQVTVDRVEEEEEGVLWRGEI